MVHLVAVYGEPAEYGKNRTVGTANRRQALLRLDNNPAFTLLTEPMDPLRRSRRAAERRRLMRLDPLIARFYDLKNRQLPA